jgi:hypothetical protein
MYPDKSVVRLVMLTGCYALTASQVAMADVSYTVTARTGQLPPQLEKHYIKGLRAKTEGTGTSTIVDLGAQTLTRMNHLRKVYCVVKLSEIPTAPKPNGIELTLYVEKGGTKTIGGYDTTETALTIDMDSPQIRLMRIKTQAETRLWMSPKVPGAAEIDAFNRRSAGVFTWAELANLETPSSTGGMHDAIPRALADLERKKNELPGVPLLEVFKIRAAAGGALGPNKQDWAAARAQMQEGLKRGGPEAATFATGLKRMDSMGGDPFALLMQTMESSGFSTDPIPDSVFAIPKGYTLVSEEEMFRKEKGASH